MLSRFKTMSTTSIDTTVQSAVFEALSEHLNDQDATRALNIWEKDYTTKQLSGLVSFLQEISPLIEHSQADKHALRMSLFRNLSTARGFISDPNANQQPKEIDNVSLRVLQERGDSQSADLEVFAVLCQHLIEGAQKSGFSEFGEFKLALNDHLDKSGLASVAKKSLLGWVSHEGELVKGIIPKDHLSHIVNMFYISLCEAVGPVTGDRILNYAVSQAEKTPAAQQFSPRKLL